MCILSNSDTERNPQNDPLEALRTLDLVEHMEQIHREKHITLARQARWHKRQARALHIERYFLQQEVSAVLAEAEEVVR